MSTKVSAPFKIPGFFFWWFALYLRFNIFLGVISKVFPFIFSDCFSPFRYLLNICSANEVHLFMSIKSGGVLISIKHFGEKLMNYKLEIVKMCQIYCLKWKCWYMEFFIGQMLIPVYLVNFHRTSYFFKFI